MPLTWSSLVAIREPIPIRQLDIVLDSPLQDGRLAGESALTRDYASLRGWYQTAPHQFVRVSSDGGAFVRFAWAVSAAALARALTGDSLFDDHAIAQAPRELLCGAVDSSFAAIENRAKTEDPRHVYTWTDDWSRLISIDRYHFHFRLEDVPGVESPIAIIVLPEVHYVSSAEPCAAPNGGPAASIDNSRLTEGPPSVS